MIKKAFLVLFLALLLQSCSDNKSMVCFSEKCINVEIADSPELREKGLMFRDKLGDNEGMIFVFDDEGVYPFWMKNTLIPLDIMWVDQEFKIVHIENAVPCTTDNCELYEPDDAAKYVVEVNAGFAQENFVNVGDLITIKLY